MSQWLVFNVGCIECGVSSNVVGVFESRQVANDLAKLLSTKFGWREGGQNSFEVFEMPVLNAVNAEYCEDKE